MKIWVYRLHILARVGIGYIFLGSSIECIQNMDKTFVLLHILTGGGDQVPSLFYVIPIPQNVAKIVNNFLTDDK